MKQIMFSTHFPATHPRKGEPTRFVEYIWSGLADQGNVMDNIDFGSLDVDFHIYYNGRPKVHTIRAGNHWKVGDQFVGKCWSGRPYRSKTIIITPVLTVEKVWAVEIIREKGDPVIYIDDVQQIKRGDDINTIAVNDGLSYHDFLNWFQKPFSGQIICWNKKIQY